MEKGVIMTRYGRGLLVSTYYLVGALPLWISNLISYVFYHLAGLFTLADRRLVWNVSDYQAGRFLFCTVGNNRGTSIECSYCKPLAHSIN